MRVTFLGTSAGVPTRARNVSAVALRLPQRAEVWLFDCGEATQHQIQRTDVRLSQIARVFVSHLHGDHVFGLMGLLASTGLAGAAQAIELYGPKGLEDFVRSVARDTRTTVNEQLRIHTVEPGAIYEDDEYTVTCQQLRHRLTAFGYRVTEKDRAGHLDPVRAAALGVPAGPLLGRLKRGESVTLADGRVVHGADVCGAPIKGRAVVYCTDTTYCQNSVALAEGADLLIHEATFSDEDAHLARQSTHSTASDAARVALEANARRLALTHISPRYAPGNPVELPRLLEQARAIFPSTIIAEDFMTVEVA
ncbi:MAG: ribonuclease Z [Acidobacteria bacterium]|nr:ribonuclease Z [Acidobacteriota bacterium]